MPRAPPREPALQPAEDLDPALYLLLRHGVGEPNVGRARREDRARYRQDVRLDRPLDEGAGVALVDLRHYVERALRLDDLEAPPQPVVDQVAPSLVGPDVLARVDVERDQGRLLGERGRADERVLLQLLHLVDQRARPGRVADPPAG